MSFQYMAQAIEVEGLTSNEKFVLLMICNYTSKIGECFPSIETLAKDCVLHKRTIIRCIKSLEEKGILGIKRRYKDGLKTSNLYTVFPNGDGGDTESLRSDTESLSEVTQSHLGSDTESHKPININLSNESKKNKQKKEKSKSITIDKFYENEDALKFKSYCINFALGKEYDMKIAELDFENFVNYCQSQNKKYASFEAAYRNWSTGNYSRLAKGQHKSSSQDNKNPISAAFDKFEDDFKNGNLDWERSIF